MESKLPRILTPLPGPEARKVLALDQQFVSPSYTRDYPLVAQRGKGAIVEDVDGVYTADPRVVAKTSFRPATILSVPASSPAPRCAPGCSTRKGSSSWVASSTS